MTTKLNVAACLKAIDESRAAEVLDDFVRDAAQRILNDGLQSAIASTDVFDERLVIYIEHTESVSRHQGAALVRVLSNATGFVGWKLALALGNGVRVSVNRAAFLAHIEAMRGKLLSPPGSDVVRYAGLQWVPGVYGYKATDGEYILIVKPECDWVVYRGAMDVGEGENATMSQAADAAAAVMWKDRRRVSERPA